ncbi:MAG: YkoF family thiamine/hydroxymethylpyrimidine-binding protein, partial [Chloroflexota bacterium]
ALERAFARAASSGEHLVMTILLSRGCPGETVCEPWTPAQGNREPAPTDSSRITHHASLPHVSCQWSLYPLGVPTYMDVIYQEIKRTKAAGVFTRGQHFVSRLDGDLHTVLGAIRASFDAAYDSATHVVAHVTLSANSPSRRQGG